MERGNSNCVGCKNLNLHSQGKTLNKMCRVTHLITLHVFFISL